MSKQIPEGATHEGQGEVKFWVKDYVPGLGYRYSNQRADGSFTEWQEKIGLSPAYPITPIKSEWRGPEDGLPPVGLEVEVLWCSLKGEYVTGKVLAHDEGRALFRFTSGERKGEYQAERISSYNDGAFYNFRPIRTPEQIAAEEKEVRIAELALVIKVSGWSSPEILAAYLDSHDYRKQVAP